jgi:hypothetical protein
MAKLPKGHVELGSACASNEHTPGRWYHHVDVVVSRRGAAYRCRVLETTGSDQGHLEEHHRTEVVGRGSSVFEAAAEAKGLAEEACIDGSKLAQALSKAVDAAEEAAASEAVVDDEPAAISQVRMTDRASTSMTAEQC